MKLSDEQRIAVCRILLDVKAEMDGRASLGETRHYASLCAKAQLTDNDFQLAMQATVLASLTVVEEVHYRIKMLLGLVVHDLYQQNGQPDAHQTATLRILMNAINWPVSFTEIGPLP